MATIEQELILESIYAAGFMVIGLLINRIGKFPILCMYRFETFFLMINLSYQMEMYDFLLCFPTISLPVECLRCWRNHVHVYRYSIDANFFIHCIHELWHGRKYC